MKRSWMILGLLLCIIAGVSILIYLGTQVAMSLPLALLFWLLVVGVLAAVGGIAWLAGWLPRKKAPEPEPQSSAVETAEPEPQSAVLEVPEPEPESEPEPEPVQEPSHLAAEEEVKAEPSHLTEEEIARARRLVKGPVDRGTSIINIEGIGSVYAEKLNSIDIYTTSDLLEAGATPHRREELAEKTGVSPKLVLEWVNIADLLRIRGVGEEYSDLLEEAGVDTTVELATRVPENLHAKMLEENAKKKLVRRPPTLNEVKRWVEEAKTLPRKVEY